MRLSEQRTVIGIPFYDGEGPGVLAACIKNLDNCLGNLNIDAKVIVGINGPRVSLGQTPLAYDINLSKFNTDVKFIKTPPGLVAAEKTICRKAEEEGYQRIFLTDSDISRLPMALHHMWNQGDRPLVGANYSAYPPEILIDFGIRFTPQEIALMKIFEADKHPLAREFTWQHRPPKRLKGSLLLVDTQLVQTMFGSQGIMSDSRMNRLVPDSDKQLIPEAAFMHYPRIDLMEYIQIRVRHSRAAASERDLETHARQEVIYNKKIAENVTREILAKYPEATEVANNFLLQSALRHEVSRICHAVISKKEFRPKYHQSGQTETNTTSPVTSFDEATRIVDGLIRELNLDAIDSPVANGRGVTQSYLPRIPIDLELFLVSDHYKRIILSHLGLDEKAEV